MESTGIQPHHLEDVAKNLIGDYGWLFIVGLIAILAQSSIKKLAASIFVFVGGDYKTDDVVFVDGKPARIIRVGFVKTVFFIYDVHEGKIVGGSKLVVANSKLKDLKIEKPLPNLDLSKYQKKK